VATTVAAATMAAAVTVLTVVGNAKFGVFYPNCQLISTR
jgi:hypothetical protein